jgi:hypothetical protein
MAVNDLQELQRRMNTATLRDDAQMVQGIPPRQQAPMAPQQAPMMQQQLNISKPPTGEQIKDGLFNAAFENLAKKAGVDLVGPIREVMEIAQMSEEQPVVTRQYGGLIGMAAGGKFEGKVPGQGHGMEDNVYMPIKEGSQQVATLAVSPDEYVVDAHTMSALGNGNADEGARYMDSMVKNIRQKAFGTDKQPNEINGLAALRPMIERV